MNVSQLEITNISEKPLKQSVKAQGMSYCRALPCDKRPLNTIPSNKLRGAYGFIPSFGQIQLDTINLKKVVDKNKSKLVPAKFSELDCCVKEDIKKMETILSNWKKALLCGYFSFDFKHLLTLDRRFFVIEEESEEGDIARNLMELEVPVNGSNNRITVQLLQSAPEIANNTEALTRGAGELALYEAVKMAKEQKLDSVNLYSINNSFYDKMGFEKLDEDSSHCSNYELTASKFDEFMERVEKKYNLKDVK